MFACFFISKKRVQLVKKKKRKETRPVVATKLEGRSIALRRPVYIRGINAIMQNLFRRTKAILGISRLQEHSS